MPRGKFITFEGIEGVGKTSQIEAARHHLEAHGLAVCVTREPGGTLLGERIRELLLAQNDPPMTPMTELLLMFTARNEHCARVIFPTLDAGIWVISDRFHDASYAYQGGGRGLAVDDIAALENLILRGRAPDLTLLFDAPVELALRRARSRRGAPDRFETERTDFFIRARERYLIRAEADPVRFRIIDATASLEEVSAAVATALNELTVT